MYRYRKSGTRKLIVPDNDIENIEVVEDLGVPEKEELAIGKMDPDR